MCRYDFHRGVDIPIPIGTPLVAIDDGTVRIAGSHPAYSDGVVQVLFYVCIESYGNHSSNMKEESYVAAL